MIINHNFKNVASLVLATLFILSSYAQEAENLFQKDYSKLSIVYQYGFLQKSFAANNDGSSYPSMDFTNTFSNQFGVYYNFAQSGNFNFKTGIIAREFVPEFDLNINSSDTNNRDYLLTQYDPFSQFMLSIPFKTDYYLPLSKKVNVVFGAGVNANVITGMNEEIGVRVGIADG